MEPGEGRHFITISGIDDIVARLRKLQSQPNCNDKGEEFQNVNEFPVPSLCETWVLR
jgi:hypothetical protein